MSFSNMPEELGLLTRNAIREGPPSIESPHFTLLRTACSGLGAYAADQIPAQARILVACRPFVSVIYKPFKKEVCAECFSYDNGRKMKISHMAGEGKNTRGLAWFCQEDCRGRWIRRIGQDGIQGLFAISTALSKAKKAKSVGDARHKALSEEEIAEAWRNTAQPCPGEVRLIEEEDDEDTLNFLLDGIIARHNCPAAWHTFCSLAPSLQPYLDNSPLLASHIRLYRFLRLHLPQNLQPSCTPETILALITRDHGNSFGIFERDLERDGEMLGYGSWVEASFFNHSCVPKVRKERQDQSFAFDTLGAVAEGAELSISYIGDASEMPLRERRKRLLDGWDFECQCQRCTQESRSGNPIV